MTFDYSVDAFNYCSLLFFIFNGDKKTKNNNDMGKYCHRAPLTSSKMGRNQFAEFIKPLTFLVIGVVDLAQ